MPYLLIGDVAQRAGVAPSAIRYYESAGILPPAERVNGRRRYGPDVLHQLHAIGVAKQAGFTMAEIRTLFNAGENGDTPSAVWRRFAEQKLHEVELLIQRAQTMQALLEEGLRCGCLRLDECTVLGSTGDVEEARPKHG